MFYHVGITLAPIVIHYKELLAEITNEPWHEISNNVVCETSKGSDQPEHMRSLHMSKCYIGGNLMARLKLFPLISMAF